jgi:hypothetical protein
MRHSPPTHISAEELQTLHTQATKGDAKAQYNLGGMYLSGQGVPKGLVQAHLWLSMAAAEGNSLAAQLVEAQRLASQCQAQNFKGC